MHPCTRKSMILDATIIGIEDSLASIKAGESGRGSMLAVS